MKTKLTSIDRILTPVFGAKPERAPLPKPVTHTMSIWEVSQLHHLFAKAHQTADVAYNHARDTLAAAHEAKMESWKALAEIETLLESMEIQAGIAGQTRFLTVEAEEEDEEHA